MDDEEQIVAAYKEMYRAMIAKDKAGLDVVLDDSFVLVHMTGMRQPKTEFIKAVLNGTLNYYSAEHENMPVEITGDTAILTGQSYVAAAVFGGGRTTSGGCRFCADRSGTERSNWHLEQKCSMKKTMDGWKITKSVASTY